MLGAPASRFAGWSTSTQATLPSIWVFGLELRSLKERMVLRRGADTPAHCPKELFENCGKIPLNNIYHLNVPPNSHVEILTPSVRVLGRGALGGD